MTRPLAALLALLAASPAGAQPAIRQFCADNRALMVAALEIWDLTEAGTRGGRQLMQVNWLDGGRTACLQTDSPHGVFVQWWVSLNGQRMGFPLCASGVRSGRAVLWGSALTPACTVE